MKKLIGTFVFIFFGLHLFGQNFTLTDNGSSVKFTIKNFGLNVAGSFNGLTGKVAFNPENPALSSFSASVAAASVNTGIESRDNHLKKEGYFDVVKYPLISFVSSRITNSKRAGIWLMEGNITIKGVTKKLSFPFTVTPAGDGYLFTGEFQIDRRDFGVGSGSMVLSDKLQVSLSVIAKKN